MTEDPSPARAGRLLLRTARAGSLATSAEGQPFVSLVTPATAPDASVLLLLSDLSEHTRHLRTDPRCAIMLTAPAIGPNPQTAPRLTITGLATLEPDPALKARWIALHPYAAFYAGFGDFHLWRLRPMAGLFIGGFASAHRLRQADLLTDQPAITAAESSILSHCNTDHADTMNAIARAHGATGHTWRMVTADPDGFDLAQADEVRRIPWPAPLETPAAIRDALIHLATAAKTQQ